jgi:acyl-coenzyme A synthetase/AMP-(fatty) acid ligase
VLACNLPSLAWRQVVILHSFNTLEFPLIFLALNRLGAVCSTSSPLFNADELASQIEIAEVSRAGILAKFVAG